MTRPDRSQSTDTAYEQGRWRHATRYVRLRPDLGPVDVAVAAATDRPLTG